MAHVGVKQERLAQDGPRRSIAPRVQSTPRIVAHALLQAAPPACGAGVQHTRRAGRGHRQGLLGKKLLARGQNPQTLRLVQLMRSSEDNAIHIGTLHQPSIEVHEIANAMTVQESVRLPGRHRIDAAADVEARVLLVGTREAAQHHPSPATATRIDMAFLSSRSRQQSSVTAASSEPVAALSASVTLRRKRARALEYGRNEHARIRPSGTPAIASNIRLRAWLCRSLPGLFSSAVRS